jgi:hypothetical protein
MGKKLLNANKPIRQLAFSNEKTQKDLIKTQTHFQMREKEKENNLIKHRAQFGHLIFK